MIFPNCKTERLTLDKLHNEDQHFIFELFSNANVVKYYDLDALESPEQSKQLIDFFNSRFKESSGIRWAIRLKNDNKCIGTCGFNSWQEKSHTASIGYDLNQAYWGQGLITESLFKIIDLAFTGQLACKTINRIQADTVPGNLASESVLRKLGFKEEGIRRQSGYWKNSYHNLKCFGLLKTEFSLK